jgi:hypothetical protein
MASATCPKCRTRLTIIAGEQPVCPGCGAKFKMQTRKAEPVAVAASIHNSPDPMWPPPIQATTPEVPEPIIPPVHFADQSSGTAPQPAKDANRGGASDSDEFSQQIAINAYQSPASSSHYRPQFQPRQYPAMRIIITVMYVFAGLVLCSFCISVLLFIVALAGGANAAANDQAGMAAFGVATAVAGLAASFVAHALLIVVFMASAESIKVWLDIQQNTQEMAYYSRARNWA